MGKLSDNAASQLAKAIVNADKYKPPVVNYGTIVETGGQHYVKIDGSTYETPFISLTDTRPDERVTVEVINHQVIVKGNMTNPAIGKKTVEETVNRIDNDMDDLEEDYNNKIDETNYNLEELRKEAEKERKRIEDELNAAKEDLGTRVDAAQADADQAGIDAEAARHVAVDYIKEQSDGFYVGTTAYPEYHVRIYSGGIEIRKGYSNPIVLSHWDASELVVGQSNKFHSKIGVNQMSLRGPRSSSDSTIVDYVTLKTDGLTVGRPNTFRSTFNIDGMHCYDASGGEYAKYTTTNFTLGYTGTGKVNLYGTNTALQFRSGTTVLTEYALDKILLGPASGANKNILINQNGIALRQGTNNLASFTTNGVELRNGTSSLASFAANKITLGVGNANAVIDLCGSKGTIDYSNHYLYLNGNSNPTRANYTLSVNGTNTSMISDNLCYLAAENSGISGRGGHVSFFLQANGSGFMARATGLVDGSYNVSGGRVEYGSWPGSGGNYSYLHTDYVSDIEFMHSAWFWVASSESIKFTTPSFTCNGTDLLATPSVATTSLYESQLESAEAITNLYENQLAMNEAITYLYESNSQ